MRVADRGRSRMHTKGAAVLAFLRDSATIRRKRIPAYGPEDRILWLAELPRDRDECRSPFLSEFGGDSPGFWLEVRKKPMPIRPPVPPIVEQWVRAADLDQIDQEPQLLPELTVVVERAVPDPDAPEGTRKTVLERFPQVRRLSDHPEVQEAWARYVAEQWKPWAEQVRRWAPVQRAYDTLDFMRRRLEASEERYELVLAVGLLQWRDPTGINVERHFLTAPAEFLFDAERGQLTVTPAATFDTFTLELDMLDSDHRPRLNKAALADRLESLDERAWDTALVEKLLRTIANSLRADAQVDMSLERPNRIGERPRISFAPAIVLRERRSVAYEELVRNLYERAVSGQLTETIPWQRLLAEGEGLTKGIGGQSGADGGRTTHSGEEGRLLFPLPTNEEQRQIAQRLERDPCVLVKGPPGTGKSHTIANLICHLLALGERVLVTAQAAKALSVLRGLLPEDFRDLCVTALGSSREHQRLLEESIRGILRRRDQWPGPEAAQRGIEQAEAELRRLESELSRVQLDLRTFREAETHRHELPGGYSGTAGQIARKVAERASEFSWMPELSADSAFPLSPPEAEFLAKVHARYTAGARGKLELEVGDVDLPTPEEFESLIREVRDAKASARRAVAGLDASRLRLLDSLATEELLRLRGTIEALANLALRAERVLGPASAEIIRDLLASARSRWVSLAQDSELLVRKAEHLREAVRGAYAQLPNGVAEEQLSADIDRLLAHFESGGRRGFFIFVPRVIRETRYIFDQCRLNGKRPADVRDLRCIRASLQLRHVLQDLRHLWGSSLTDVERVGLALSRANELTSALKEVLAFLDAEQVAALETVLGPNRVNLSLASGRAGWVKAIDAVVAMRHARDAQKELDRLVNLVRGSHAMSKPHPCLQALEAAVRLGDAAAWRKAWEERERLRRAKAVVKRYEDLVRSIGACCPELAQLIQSTEGNPDWSDRFRRLREAWDWASARAWLRRFNDSRRCEASVHRYHQLKKEIERETEKLASLRAWKAFFDRLEERTVQSLTAWAKAVDRIGKGTGKHAHRHRRSAQRYLMECVPSIPAWIMPLHRVWDSVRPEPGLFDTVIIDEASQAGIDALVLLLLAKRIVVVGDDKQNSPEAVGIPEEDIARLIREHLRGFRFRDEFRPDASLFDHAERVFGGHITLREHFRCVPEIIRFSNELCYRDTPLIPLRQAPPKRLQPLCSRFVPDGVCRGEGQRVVNPREAEAIADTIVKIVSDEAYEGKTLGVIALQGHAQAQLIERLLAQRLEPKVIEERRVRCGEPATFQGDERDVIFLSLVIAPNVQYRALSRLPDVRRFNVAMSRARDQVWLFHSVRQQDLSPEDLRRRLIAFFESPQLLDTGFEELKRLEVAARAGRGSNNRPQPYDSWFEVDVAMELLRRGYRVRPQVDVAGYRIDLVVEGLQARLAVECDGDQWHGPEQYERDMARQRQLERAGWTFVRVRESEFYTDRERSVEAIVAACDLLGIEPLGLPDRTVL